MSIVEQEIHFVEPPPVSFVDGDIPPIEWFSPSFLKAINHHPLDDTIQYTTKRTFFVRWFDSDSDQRHDDSTASVTSLVPRPPSADRIRGVAVHGDRRSMGVQMHRWIECVLNGFPMTIETILQQQVLTYYKTYLYGQQIPWRTEMAVRSASDIRLVGIIDALFIDAVSSGDGTLSVHMKDWKYSPDVSSCMAEYTLQLNLYKYILESHYAGITFYVDNVAYNRIHVASMELVVFHETLTTCNIVNVPDIQTTVQVKMDERKKCIK
jgi:hypothetical protein